MTTYDIIPVGTLACYDVTGSRAHDLTARFDVWYLHAHESDERVLDHADWPTTYTFLCGTMPVSEVDGFMRAILPPVEYAA